ncbi:MAG TPA: ribosomal protein S18-alanine N-acetyltransferase [Gammaproteobacteria bacterium]|nr:ribosomal protein S18-alanine N-acetyltransferase [Gammaproteobacteria bacterium]HRA42379.1 ribosomal protein S18-alanine N-acetyltransferase [Gammaproteobacteria bacterium]
MIIIRKMQQADVESVMGIEQEVVDFPWTYSIFSDCIKVGYGCWVLEDEEEVVGYGLLSVAAAEGHILNLVIKPDRHHQGLGRRLLMHLIEQAKTLKATSVYLEVRRSNEIAYDLYIKTGFIVIGERKDYYPALDGREDALVLELSFKI